VAVTPVRRCTWLARQKGTSYGRSQRPAASALVDLSTRKGHQHALCNSVIVAARVLTSVFASAPWRPRLLTANAHAGRRAFAQSGSWSAIWILSSTGACGSFQFRMARRASPSTTRPAQRTMTRQNVRRGVPTAVTNGHLTAVLHSAAMALATRMVQAATAAGSTHKAKRMRLRATVLHTSSDVMRVSHSMPRTVQAHDYAYPCATYGQGQGYGDIITTANKIVE
jgi:hypothetical protein